jgi:hypothetical protein
VKSRVQVGTMSLPKPVAYSLFGGFGTAILVVLTIF